MPRSKKARHPVKAGRPPEDTPPKRRDRLARIAAALVAAALFSGIAVYAFLAFASGDSTTAPKTAAIVDQLSLTQPNAAFAETATKILEDAGYSVDYFPGEAVTVGFYKDLPTRGYGLLILRVHSGLARDRGEPTGYVSLFTGEPFSETKYVEEKEAGLVGRATYFDGGPQVFGIVPDFIDSAMEGRFDGSTVLMLGCDGLITDTTADALVRKGARTVVGWDGPVTQEHTDAAGENLLRHLLADGLSLDDAVARTMAEVGADPEYESKLLVYPSSG